jgi:hypothetical protein
VAGSKADVIDQKLVSYFEHLFAAGRNPYVGSVTLASLSHNHPPLGHGNRSQRTILGHREEEPLAARRAEADAGPFCPRGRALRQKRGNFGTLRQLPGEQDAVFLTSATRT